MLKHVLLAFVLSVARGQDNAHVRIDTGGEIHVARGGSFVIGATPEVADPSPPSASPLPPPSPSPAPPPLHTTADLYIPFIASEGGYTDAITNLAPTTTSMSNMPSTGFTYASFNTASDANDYVAYPASSAAHVGTGDFTITFRMRTDTYSTADGGNHRRIYVTDGPSGKLERQLANTLGAKQWRPTVVHEEQRPQCDDDAFCRRLCVALVRGAAHERRPLDLD